MYQRNIFYTLLLSMAVLWQTPVLAEIVKTKRKFPLAHQELMSKSQYVLTVNCQVIRSRAQSSLAGTITENYQMNWSVSVLDQRIHIESIYGVVDAHWQPDASQARLGSMTLMRSELVKLLGLEQELPQDSLLWHAEAPIMLPVIERGNRSIEQVLRHADDNGMLIVRMAVRI